jgi:hypothetical protein
MRNAKITIEYDGCTYEGMCTNWTERPTVGNANPPYWIQEFNVSLEATVHLVKEDQHGRS